MIPDSRRTRVPVPCVGPPPAREPAPRPRSTTPSNGTGNDLLAEFGRDLRQLREQAGGPSLHRLAAEAGPGNRPAAFPRHAQ